jgi:hypothetical protein
MAWYNSMFGYFVGIGLLFGIGSVGSGIGNYYKNKGEADLLRAKREAIIVQQGDLLNYGKSVRYVNVDGENFVFVKDTEKFGKLEISVESTTKKN